MKIFAATSIGHEKSRNEDWYLVHETSEGAGDEQSCYEAEPEGEPVVLAVADGVSASYNGQKAARIACEILQETVREGAFQGVTDQTFPFRCSELVRKIAEEMNDRAEDPFFCLDESSTTLSLAFVEQNRIYAFNVGDSPILLLRDGELLRCYTEHNLYGEKVRRNARRKRFWHFWRRGEEETLSEADKYALTRCVRNTGADAGASQVLDRKPGDVLLLASDGAVQGASDEELKRLLLADSPAEAVVNAALARNVTDNITAVVVR